MPRGCQERCGLRGAGCENPVGADELMPSPRNEKRQGWRSGGGAQAEQGGQRGQPGLEQAGRRGCWAQGCDWSWGGWGAPGAPELAAPLSELTNHEGRIHGQQGLRSGESIKGSKNRTVNPPHPAQQDGKKVPAHGITFSDRPSFLDL